MSEYINEIEKLIHLLTYLPGVGPKNAERIAFFLANTSKDFKEDFISTLSSLSKNVRKCEICHNFSNDNICKLCSSTERDNSILCVVEKPQDLLAVEKSGAFRGRYYVLHKLLSPVDNILPDDIDVNGLINAIKRFGVKEVILALKSSVEGEATSILLFETLKSLKVKITKLATGLPKGGELEFVDEKTIYEAILGRKNFEN